MRDPGGDRLGLGGEIEVDCDLAAPTQVHAAGDVEEPRELGEAIAIGLGRDRSELVA